MQIAEQVIVAGITRLRHKGLAFEEGLSEAEIARVEALFLFTFPPDLRFFLQLASPISSYFVNWRSPSAVLVEWMHRQVEGVLFDVQHGGFWYSEWGDRPTETAEALMVAESNLAAVPRLIPIGDPIFTKCIPATPNEAGNPVFSIHQTDILHAGRDLGDFLQWFSRPKETFERDEEEGTEPTQAYCESYRHIEFWTELTRENVVGGWKPNPCSRMRWSR